MPRLPLFRDSQSLAEDQDPQRRVAQGARKLDKTLQLDLLAGCTGGAHAEWLPPKTSVISAGPRSSSSSAPRMRRMDSHRTARG